MSALPSTLGPYPVERELGRGGMGIVYLARDPRLNRPIAIKVLPDLLAFNPESLARFEREAKLLASLNHPNIATIYGIEEANGQRLIVLEYVPGDTLAVRTAQGPLPIDEAIDIGRQIALAVEAAHEGGVIHRDLKPGNVKITPDGQVKVLDFGLAKGSAAVSDAELAHSPTITYAPTGAGVILGTAGYMSPEQARGKPVDRRTDIWSFGCVLFECLAGKQIFEGETVSDTIAKILEREPDWAALPANTPPRVRELLRRCLEKDLKKRQRDIGDVRIELEEAAATRSSAARSASSVVVAPAESRRSWIGRGALLVAAGAILGAGLWAAFGPAGQGSGGASGVRRLSIAVPPSIRATYGGITPDGKTVIIAGFDRKADGSEDPQARLYARHVDAYELKPIPGTEGVQSYAYSPDGHWIAVVGAVSAQSSSLHVIRVPVDGSAPPVAIADWDDGWNTPLAWLADGDLLIVTRDGTKFVRLPASGGAAKAPVAIDTGGMAATFSINQRLPDGRGVLLSSESWGSKGYEQQEWTLDLATAKARQLFDRAGTAAYASSGQILFMRGGTLMAAMFDLAKQAPAGESFAILDGVRKAQSWDNGTFEISDDGTLIYPPGGLLGVDRRIVVVDAAGTATPFVPDRRGFEAAIAASADGRKAAVVIPTVRGTYETWIADQDRTGLRRTLFLPNADCAFAVWSHDGRQLAYHRTAIDADDGVYVQSVDGATPPRLVARDESKESRLVVESWAPDASGLLGVRRAGKASLVFIPAAADGSQSKPRLLRSTTANESNPRFSPDGRFVSFYSDESGRGEVYVASYAGGTLGPPAMVSNGANGRTAWTADGRRLVYAAPGGQKLLSVTLNLSGGISASPPTVAYDLRRLRVTPGNWDLLPDGRLMAIQNGEGEDDITTFNVVLNFFDELRARMGKSAR